MIPFLQERHPGCKVERSGVLPPHLPVPMSLEAGSAGGGSLDRRLEGGDVRGVAP